MQDTKITNKHICMGILAHVDAGKTTLAEGMLYECGVVRTPGRVDHKDAYLDTDAMERDRGITIFSKIARMQYENLEITLLDTPGHVDFGAEMERTLQVLDCAVLVVSGADGVQGHTRTLWKLLDRYDIPTFLFVNKMDQPDTDPERLIAQIKKELSDSCVPTPFANEPGAKAIGPDITEEVWEESAAACDEALMEEYFETENLSDEAIQGAVAERKLFPVYFGAALHQQGIRELLAGICRYMPQPEYEDEFGARVFKISRDEKGRRLTHMKITGGSLRARTLLTGKMPSLADSAGAMHGADDSADDGDEIWSEKVDQLRLYNGTAYEQTEAAGAGMIVSVTGLSNTYIGEGLGFEMDDVQAVLEPVLSYRMILPDEIDAARALQLLQPLQEEDPQLQIVWEEKLREIHVHVMGQVQIEILQREIAERFGMEVSFGAGSIIYKETLSGPVYGIGHFEPLRHYAEVQLLLEPGEPGSGITFASDCSVDDLDKNWQRLIRTHVEETRHPGALMGCELTDVQVTLMIGRAHPKHTEGGDFRQATYRAIRNGLRKAREKGCAKLLEPFIRFRLELPTEFVGRAMTDIEQRFGTPGSPVLSADGSVSVLEGIAPVSTFHDYTAEVAAYTGGRGILSSRPAGYFACHNQEEIVTAAMYDPEGDLRRPTGSVFCAHGAGFPVPWDEVAGYAHLEPRWSAETGVIHTDESGALTAAPHAAYVSTKGTEERTISIEEIDAIFAGQHRNKKADERTRRRYHVKRAAAADSTYKGHSGSRTITAPRKKCLLVDGYNIVHAWEELAAILEKSFDGARDRLIDICSEYQGIIGGEVIVVFDAYRVPGGVGSITKQGNIYVVFTQEAETADQYIERATHKMASAYEITVATSDRLEQMIVWGNGAYRLSANEFREAVEKGRAQLRTDYMSKTESIGNKLPL